MALVCSEKIQLLVQAGHADLTALKFRTLMSWELLNRGIHCTTISTHFCSEALRGRLQSTAVVRVPQQGGLSKAVFLYKAVEIDWHDWGVALIAWID